MIGRDRESFTETLYGILRVPLDPPEVADLIEDGERVRILNRVKIHIYH